MSILRALANTFTKPALSPEHAAAASEVTKVIVHRSVALGETYIFHVRPDGLKALFINCLQKQADKRLDWLPWDSAAVLEAWQRDADNCQGK